MPPKAKSPSSNPRNPTSSSTSRAPPVRQAAVEGSKKSRKEQEDKGNKDEDDEDQDDEDFVMSDEDDEDEEDEGGVGDEEDVISARPVKRVKLEDGNTERRLSVKDVAQNTPTTVNQTTSVPSQTIDELWASFNEPANTSSAPANPASSSGKPNEPDSGPPVGKRMIKIQKAYKFAGQTTIEEKEVPADSEEGKAWLREHPDPSTSANSEPPKLQAPLNPNPEPASNPDTPSSASTRTTTSTQISDQPTIQQSSTTDRPSLSSSATVTATTQTTKGPHAGPGRSNKPRASLSSMASDLGIGKKAAKINTLEKSKLDWNKYVESNDLAESLTRARKDGFLEKQDFLERTRERRDEAEEKVRDKERSRRMG